jgi:hypothetical protein
METFILRVKVNQKEDGYVLESEVDMVRELSDSNSVNEKNIRYLHPDGSITEYSYSGDPSIGFLESNFTDYPYYDLDEKLSVSGDLRIKRRQMFRSPPKASTFVDTKEDFVIVEDAGKFRKLYRQEKGALVRYSAKDHSVTSYRPYKNMGIATYICGDALYFTNGYEVYLLKERGVKDAVLLNMEGPPTVRAIFSDHNYTTMPWTRRGTPFGYGEGDLLINENYDCRYPDKFSTDMLLLDSDNDSLSILNIHGEVKRLGQYQRILTDSLVVDNQGKLLYLIRRGKKWDFIPDSSPVPAQIYPEDNVLLRSTVDSPDDRRTIFSFMINPVRDRIPPKEILPEMTIKPETPGLFIPGRDKFCFLKRKSRTSRAMRKPRNYSIVSQSNITAAELKDFPLRTSIPIEPSEEFGSTFERVVFAKRDVSEITSVEKKHDKVVFDVETSEPEEQVPSMTSSMFLAREIDLKGAGFQEGDDEWGYSSSENEDDTGGDRGEFPVPIRRDPVPIRRDPVPIRRDSVPIRRDSVPIRRDPVPIRRDSVPIRRDSVPIRRDPGSADVDDPGSADVDDPGSADVDDPASADADDPGSGADDGERNYVSGTDYYTSSDNSDSGGASSTSS